METAINSKRIVPKRKVPDYTTDEYYYGYRMIVDENTGELISYRPLTLDDFLEPEEGDVYMQGNVHVDDVIRLRSIFKHHLRNRKNLTVFCDMKIIWGIDGLKNPAPDISIVADVKEPEKPRGVFSVPEEGVKPFFVLEVVSPRYRGPDINKKPEIYRKAGVLEYIIVDPGLKGNKISYTVSGYKLFGNRYVKIEPDQQGRIISQTTGLKIGVSKSKDKLIVYDSRTGEEILSDDERAEQEKSRAEWERLRAEEEKARAEQEKVRTEQERVRAEQEKVRAEIAEAELKKLKEKLRELGVSA